ncbi:Lrp/AsnC family transcriptional regulator [Thiohalobacter thiocyanaticus]|uniref:siroheme decarboxylase n=2 Tax=Thiohalobacter thiocyanaticus TaxID=585455 RepID=A0A426QJ04_9GAMM|nr:Lrp/AsnC family transcriptional regulator [Thiohalobacter thiocyanaticus]
MHPLRLDGKDRALVALIQQGLPLVPRPFAELGRRIGMTEEEVMQRMGKLRLAGAIKRFGVVVRHRELGYRANAMVVWDVPETDVAGLGNCLARYPFITLCYRRPRRLPHWPYNLFTMIHGQSRGAVCGKLAQVIGECGLHDIPHEILFSRRRFKQCGARYCEPVSERAGVPA